MTPLDRVQVLLRTLTYYDLCAYIYSMTSYETRFDSPCTDTFTHESIALSALSEGLGRKRLAADLIDVGLIQDHQVIEEFPGDARHILIGDGRSGGGHHLASILALGVDDRVIASQIAQINEGPIRTLPALRKKQKLRDNGQYRANIVQIGLMSKNEGSSMFPDTWSAEDILKAVTEVSGTGPVKTGGEPFTPYSIHREVINEVRIQVIVSHLFKKHIRAAYPF